MIHSLSGGSLGDKSAHRFVKVGFSDGEECWFLCDEFAVSVGTEVVAPRGDGAERGRVVRVENADRNSAPLPLNRVKSIINIVF